MCLLPHAGPRIALSLLLSSFLLTEAAEVGKESFDPPFIAQASDQGELAMKQFVLQPGFKVELFAAEPLLANPVAFNIDDRGRFFIAETFRHGGGVTDIRGHMNWLDEDLANRTVEDRLAMLKRHEGSRFPNYSRRSDRIKLLWDSDQDGRADKSSVFADGFYDPVSGIGSGVLAYDGNVYYANLPDLWHLTDENDDGQADNRHSLLHGFGVRVGFLGHDLHGVTFGPDGKIYFTIGDRGASVVQGDRRVGEPDSGAVYRCNPDGSQFEIFCFGLRNPQEIAFDEFGNLFTVDNNSDGGDRARLLYLMEGADYGWRIGYQFIERPNSRGPWNSEKLWHPAWDGQAAYLLPAIANITDGPSGMAYYPGTGLPEKYRGTFLVVDFHGGRGSGILAFKVKRSGAGFALGESERLIWESLPTDVEFGPDGAIYFTDWVQGWGTTGKGRIYKVSHPEALANKQVAETRQLLTAPMRSRKTKQLAELLSHADFRVRQRAQFELARRGSEAIPPLNNATRHGNPHTRVHALWALGQIAPQIAKKDLERFLTPVRTRLRDEVSEVAAQAAKVLGDSLAGTRETGPMADDLLKALSRQNPAVQLQAALALGKAKAGQAVPLLIDLLAANNNQDRYLRQALTFALARIGDVPALLKTGTHHSPAARLGAVLALRQLQRAEISQFLTDSDPAVVLETARAINDLPISGAQPELAALTLSNPSVELARRVVNANLRYGTRETAQRLVTLAQDESLPESARVEAAAALGKWPAPTGRDQITGLWRPVVGARKSSDLTDSLKTAVASLLESKSDSLRIAAISSIAALQLEGASDPLAKVLRNETFSPRSRVEALKTIGQLKAQSFGEALTYAAASPNEDLRKEALRLQAAAPGGGLTQLRAVIERGTLGEKQAAFASLATSSDPGADQLLLQYLDQLATGQLARELHLDLLESASKRPAPAVKARLESYRATLPADDQLAPLRGALQGGNAEEGKRVFVERADAGCVRCHKAAGVAGGEVGPSLETIGATKDRQYLLESLILPNKHIAEGFESVIVETKDGVASAGVLKSESDTELVINSPEDGILTVKKGEIARRVKGLSAMPEGLQNLLSPHDLRNLVEFLANSK